MKASRSSCFQPTKSLALALSLSFACGQLVLATPEPAKTAKPRAAAAAPKVEASAPKVEAATPKVEAAASPSKDSASNAGKDEESTGKQSEAAETNTESPDKKADLNIDTTTTAAKIKEELQTEEALHETGVFHWDLSKKYSKDGDLDLAQTELDLAVMNWPDMKVAHRDLCLLSLMRFNFMRSIAEFMMTVGLGEAIPMTEEEGSKLVEESMIKHYKKGLVYARQQDWSKTVNELELAAHLVSDDFAVQRALAFAYANQGNFSKAEQHYKTTFELSPHDGSSRADLAYFLAQNGKVGEAQKEMEEAVRSQPKAAAYHVDLSWMAETRGDLDTACKELQEAVSLSPKHADLWAHLGRVFERKGEKSQAVDAYSKAIFLDPQLADAKQALTKLQSAPEAQSPDQSAPAHAAASRT